MISSEAKIKKLLSDGKAGICKTITGNIVRVLGDESLEKIIGPIRDELNRAADRAAMLIRRRPSDESPAFRGNEM